MATACILELRSEYRGALDALHQCIVKLDIRPQVRSHHYPRLLRPLDITGRTRRALIFAALRFRGFAQDMADDIIRLRPCPDLLLYRPSIRADAYAVLVALDRAGASIHCPNGCSLMAGPHLCLLFLCDVAPFVGAAVALHLKNDLIPQARIGRVVLALHFLFTAVDLDHLIRDLALALDQLLKRGLASPTLAG